MNLVIAAETAPLETNVDGVVQVGKTRVTLDTVVAVFKQGMTAEEIAYRYPSLKLADVYATIAFYLNHHVISYHTINMIRSKFKLNKPLNQHQEW